MSCPACFQGVERTDAKPTGRQTRVHGLDCYVASPANGLTKGIIVIVPDAFGWTFVNNRLLADEYARQGSFDVYLPDFMDGENMYPQLVGTTADGRPYRTSLPSLGSRRIRQRVTGQIPDGLADKTLSLRMGLLRLQSIHLPQPACSVYAACRFLRSSSAPR